MAEIQKTFPLPHARPALIEFLETRRSNLAKLMKGPGPSEEVVEKILEISARVPDHRKLAPWRFIVFKDEARANFGQHIAASFMKGNSDAPVDRVMFEGQRLMRAPLVIAVVSSPDLCPRGTPDWEQKLSAGAVCFNMCLAAQAHGFGAQWLTEWYSYDDAVNAELGLSETEAVAGYIYIGTVDTPAAERTRPDLKNKVKVWS